jgi:hypothetical protein
MFIVTQNQSGALTGTGRYPTGGPYTITWVLKNSLVTGSGDVTLTLDYDSSSYEATLIGTVATDWNSMGGSGTSGGVSTWIATRIP